MGYMSTSTTSKTTIPKPTPEELGLINLTRDGLMTSYLDEAGYDVTKSSTTWMDSPEAQSYNSKIADAQSKLADLQNDYAMARDPSTKKSIQSQISFAQSNVDNLSKQMSKAQSKFSPSITYDVRKKDDIATEAVREQYGADSPQYAEAHKAYQAKQAEAEQQRQRVDVLTMSTAEKFLKGDFGITPDQQKFIDDQIGPIKTAGLAAVQYIKDEAGITDKALKGDIANYVSESEKTGKSLDDALNVFRDQVKQTGMDMGDAIVELENRVKTTGANMKQAFEESINYSKALVEMGIQDFSLATRQQVAQQASSLGRSPTDPEFIAEMQGAVTREIQRSGLQFGQMSAEGRMGIEERTGAGLENAANLRLQTAERTGAGLEQAAQTGLSIAERTGAARENAAQMTMGVDQATGAANMEAARLRGQVEVGAAENASNMSTQIGMGQPVQQVGLGINVGQYNQSIEQMRLQNAQAAMQAPLPLIQYYQNNRTAQPTTTTTQKGSVAGMVSGIIGAGLSGAGALAAGGVFKPSGG